MPFRPSYRFAALRHALAALVVVGLAAQAEAASPVMTPFNLPVALDGGVVQAEDGLSYGVEERLKLDVFVPENLQAPAPVVVFIYGGAWKQGSRSDYVFVGHALAARGFVTVIPDYRLVPEVQYPEFIEDAARAVKWAEDNIARYGGDANRLYLSGHSAGAYTSVMMGLDSAYLDQAGVTVPVRGVAALSGPYDFYPFEFGEVRDAFGNADNPQATQPVNIVGADAPPMLLITGMMDPIVKPVNSETLAAKLRLGGVPVREIRYEGLGHMDTVVAMASVWRWRAPVLDDVTGFFDELEDTVVPLDLIPRTFATPAGAEDGPMIEDIPSGDADIAARVEAMLDRQQAADGGEGDAERPTSLLGLIFGG